MESANKKMKKMDVHIMSLNMSLKERREIMGVQDSPPNVQGSPVLPQINGCSEFSSRLLQTSIDFAFIRLQIYQYTRSIDDLKQFPNGDQLCLLMVIGVTANQA
jgi:hypothetical protein